MQEVTDHFRSRVFESLYSIENPHCNEDKGRSLDSKLRNFMEALKGDQKNGKSLYITTSKECEEKRTKSTDDDDIVTLQSEDHFGQNHVNQPKEEQSDNDLDNDPDSNGAADVPSSVIIVPNDFLDLYPSKGAVTRGDVADDPKWICCHSWDAMDAVAVLQCVDCSSLCCADCMHSQFDVNKSMITKFKEKTAKFLCLQCEIQRKRDKERIDVALTQSLSGNETCCINLVF